MEYCNPLVWFLQKLSEPISFVNGSDCALLEIRTFLFKSVTILLYKIDHNSNFVLQTHAIQNDNECVEKIIYSMKNQMHRSSEFRLVNM